MTFAEIDVLARTRREEDWDRTAFLASYAINANPYLKRAVVVRNPLRDATPIQKVDLEDVEALK